MKPKIRLIPIGGPKQPIDLIINQPEASLAEFLSRVPALSKDPIGDREMKLPVRQLNITFIDAQPGVSVYIPPGLQVTPAPVEVNGSAAAIPAEAVSIPAASPAPSPMPSEITEGAAVKLAYKKEIESVASFLRVGLSALVVCEKLVVDHLWEEMVRRAAKRGVMLKVPDEE